jgi:hypothetical protein
LALIVLLSSRHVKCIPQFGALVVLVLFDAGSEPGQEFGQRGAVLLGQAFEEGGLGRQQVGVGPLEDVAAGRGELDQDRAPVAAGTTAGPAVGGLVAEHSFLILFGCDAVTSLGWAVAAWLILPPRRTESDVTVRLSQPPHGLLGDRRLLHLLMVTVLANLVLFQAQTTLPLWAHRQGLSTAGYGLLLALNSGLVLAFQLPVTRLSGRWRPQPVIAVSSVIIGAGFGLLAVAHTAVLLAVAVTVWSLGELAQWPVAAVITPRPRASTAVAGGTPCHQARRLADGRSGLVYEHVHHGMGDTQRKLNARP